MSVSEFKGFSPDTYVFLMELAYNNDKTFFEANRSRYNENVLFPMRALATALLPTMLDIDPDFNTKLISIVSRIYRDARYSHGRPPYRDHAWLSFRRPGTSIGETFSMYFEITPDTYGYGMGMYRGEPERMASLRRSILADGARFIDIVNAPALSKYTLEGECFKRDRFPAAPETLKPYLNRKGLSWCFESTELDKTLDGTALLEEIKNAMQSMADVYRFISPAVNEPL